MINNYITARSSSLSKFNTSDATADEPIYEQTFIVDPVYDLSSAQYNVVQSSTALLIHDTKSTACMASYYFLKHVSSKCILIHSFTGINFFIYQDGTAFL